jgi:hypothetical protein
MDKIQVLELIENMATVYPNKFEVNEKTINAFHFHLSDQKYDVVIRNFRIHARESKFPPTIADLVEKKMPYEVGSHVDKIEKWEAEASGGPKC